MRVTFLGTGTSSGVPVPTCDCAICTSDDPRDRRLRPSVFLEWEDASILIDTSTDLRQQALREKIQRVDAILYTHAHADHVLGLDELRIYNWRQAAPIEAYGSADTLDKLGRTFWYVFDTGPNESTKPALDRRPVETPFELRGKTVIPVPIFHGRMPIYGYRIGRFAYVTDVSRIPESSLPLLDGLEHLVIGALRRRPHPTHMNFEQAVEAARVIGAERTWFTHLSHEVLHSEGEAELPENVRIAYDGLRLEIDEGGSEVR
ncbi:hypothetical protein ABI59_01900 [Acidobacteria bacterium Mor1]|nr:hypothetical protein ABI59_01900 [Acidobacteria bacterium Mor1]